MGFATALRNLTAAAVGLALCLASSLASAQTVAIERRLSHPDGASILLRTIDLRPDSVVLSVAIANPSGREISLDRARGLVLDDGPRGVHHLNPPLDNPEVRIAPHAAIAATLVFIGPVAPTARELTLLANQGIGTVDNPYDDLPAFRATLPLPGTRAGGYQAEHPDGATLRATRVTAGPSFCTAEISATNGNDRTIVLNQNRSLALIDDRGGVAPVEPPAGNAELVVPAAGRLDAALVFDCRAVGGAAALTLTTNRGTGGTPDNPYETLPVFALRLPVERASERGAEPPRSRATVTPIARSVLTPASVAAAVAAAVPAVSAGAPRPGPVAASAAPPPAAIPAAIPAGRTAPTEAPKPQTGWPQPPAAAAEKATPKTVPQLEAALHASHGYRGLDIVLPADTLFGASRDTVAPAADPLLADLARLIAEMHPREVAVAGHTDPTGDDADDMALSKARAQAVAVWLEAHVGKRRPRFVEQGYGRTRPVAPNHNADGSDNPAGRAQNRRVEVTLRR